MAEDHRRVEPRSIVGTGMSTDPERVEAILHDRERMERTWRAPPKRGFGDVLEEAPPLAVPDEPEDPRRRKKREASEDAPEEGAEEARAVGGEEQATPARAAAPSKPLPRVPPDPRMQKLHALLEGPARGKK